MTTSLVIARSDFPPDVQAEWDALGVFDDLKKAGLMPGEVRMFARKPDPLEALYNDPALAPLAEHLGVAMGGIERRIEKETMVAGITPGIEGIGASIAAQVEARVPGAMAAAADLVSSPFDSGLNDVFLETGNLFEGWAYSAVMDKGTCEVCAEMDGTVYIGYEAALEAMPEGGPNPDCDGGDRCRCRLVPLSADEVAQAQGLSGMPNLPYEGLPLEAPDAESMIDSANAEMNRAHAWLKENLDDPYGRAEAKNNVTQSISLRLRGNEAFERYADSGVGPLSSYYDMKMERAISGLIDQWAGSSDSGEVWSLALQRAVYTEFGLEEATLGRWAALEGGRVADAWKLSEKLFADHELALRAFVRAMYDESQAQLSASGIKELTLYRGMAYPRELLPAEKFAPTEIIFQPASSFAADIATANGFVGTNGEPILVAVRVPAERILGSARTGFGCLGENEYVVIGQKQFSDADIAVVGKVRAEGLINNEEWFWKQAAESTGEASSSLPSVGSADWFDITDVGTNQVSPGDLKVGDTVAAQQSGADGLYGYYTVVDEWPGSEWIQVMDENGSTFALQKDANGIWLAKTGTLSTEAASVGETTLATQMTAVALDAIPVGTSFGRAADLITSSTGPTVKASNVWVKMENSVQTFDITTVKIQNMVTKEEHTISAFTPVMPLI